MLIILAILTILALVAILVIKRKNKEPSLFDDMGELQPTAVAEMSDDEIAARVNARVNGAFNKQLVDDAKANLEKM